MPRKLLDKLLNNSFLKSSSAVFAINLSMGLLNYIIVIVAGRVLLGEYSLWTAMTGLVAIMITPMSGIMTEFTKQVSKYSKNSLNESLSYFKFINKKIKPFWLTSIILSLCGICVYFFGEISGTQSIFGFPIYQTIILLWLFSYMFLNITANIRQQFMLGALHIRIYALITIIIGLGKFIPTIIFLILGFKVFALPLGLLSSCVLGILFGEIFIKKLNKENLVNDNIKEYDIIKDILSASKNIVGLFLVLTFFNIAPIIGEQFLSKTDKDLFAVLFNFGQIIHFGSVAFMGVLVAFAARGKNLKVYLTSIGVVSALTIFIGGIFFFFGEFLLNLFRREQYIDQIPLILLYSVFIAFFNILFVSVQYLISHSQYKKLFALPIFLIVLVIVQILSATGNLSILGEPINSFIISSIIVGFISSCYYAILTLRYHD